MSIFIFTTFGVIVSIHLTGGSTQCGTRVHSLVSLVHHGWQIDAGLWPWHAALFHNDTGKYACGATLLSQWHVITAAHCVTYTSTEPLPAENIVLHFGKQNLSDTTSNVQVRHVGQVHVHPKYSRHKNDIALLVLQSAIEYSKFVLPICLDERVGSDLRKLESTRGWIPGWGHTENGLLSDVLRTVSMPVVSYIECLQDDRKLFGYFLDSNVFCAGDRNGSSPGFGDSGGGMYFNDNDRWVLRGIVSFGKIVETKDKVDTSKYIVFVNVQRYLKWIRGTIGDDNATFISSPASEKDTEYQYAHPVVLLVDRQWQLRENTTVNTTIAQVRAKGNENDTLEFGLEPRVPGQLQPFVIDSNTGNVYLNESVEGKGGQNFFLYVTVSDGRLTSKREVYVNIRNQNASDLNENNDRKIFPLGLNSPPGISSISQASSPPPKPTKPLVVSQPLLDKHSSSKLPEIDHDRLESSTAAPEKSTTGELQPRASFVPLIISVAVIFLTVGLITVCIFRKYLCAISKTLKKKSFQLPQFADAS